MRRPLGRRDSGSSSGKHPADGSVTTASGRSRPSTPPSMNALSPGRARAVALVAVAALVVALAYLFLGPDPAPDRSSSARDSAATAGEERPDAGTLQSLGYSGGELDRDAAAAEPLRDDALDLQFAEGGTGAAIYGRVIDPEGRPVPGATVWLAPRFRLGDPLQSDHRVGQGPRTTTDAGGRFRFDDLRAGQELNLWAWHPDWAPTAGTPVVVLADEPQELPPIVLDAGHRVFGRVEDEAGNPLPATVELLMQETSTFRRGTPEELRQEDLAQGRLLVTETDDAGRFSFDHVAEGIWSLRAQSEGFAAAEVQPILAFGNQEPEEQVLVLGTEHRITGTVRDAAGRPVANALVTVSRTKPRPIFTARTRTAEDGTFTLRGLPDGLYGLAASAEGHTNARLGRVKADGPPVDVVLQDKGGVSGRVTDAAGRPVPAFEVEVLRTRPNNPTYGITGLNYSFRSAQGEYSIPELDPGTYVLRITAPGHAPGYTPSFQVQREMVLGIDAQLGRGGTLRGRVVDGATGAPVAGATVTVHGPNFRPDEMDALFGGSFGDPDNVPPQRAVSGADGRFEIANAWPGDLQLLIEHPRYLRESVRTTVAEGGEQDLGDLRVFPGGSIVGVVRDQDGEPVSGGTVNLTRREGDGWFHRSTLLDAQGRFRFDALPEGSYEIIAYPPYNQNVLMFPDSSSAREVFVPTGEQVRVELTATGGEG